METVVDPWSLVLAAFVANTYMCVVLVLYGVSQKTYPGYNFWMLGSVLAMLAYILFGLRGWLPEVFTMVLANTTAVAFSMARLEGLRRYTGQNQWCYAGWGLVLASSVGFAYFTFVHPSPVWRNSLLTVLTLVIIAALFWNLHRHQQGESPVIRRFLMALLIITAVLFTWRGVSWVVWPAEADLLARTPLNMTLILLNMVLDISWPVCFILLNSHRLQAEINTLNHQLEQYASFDALTGLFNRRKFLELSTYEWNRAKRYKHHLSLMLFDLDNFKAVNDTFGHAAGDEVLKQVAHTCQRALRSTDVLGRLGGDEFVVLFPETNIHTAHTLAARLEQEVRAIPFLWANQVQVGLSYGIASAHPDDANLDAMLARADGGLYAMKDQRRQA